MRVGGVVSGVTVCSGSLATSPLAVMDALVVTPVPVMFAAVTLAPTRIFR